MTLLGPIEANEQVYQQGTKTLRSGCHCLGINPGYYTLGLQEAIVDFGAEDSFELAATRLNRHHRIELSSGTVRKITLQHAAQIQENNQAEGVLGTVAQSGADHIIAQADGTMLPCVECEPRELSHSGSESEHLVEDRRKLRKVSWCELRLCAAQKHKSAQCTYGCDMRSVESLGYQWSHCVGEADWGVNTAIHVVSDAASWIARQASECLGQKADCLLDFFHVSEYLAAASKASHCAWSGCPDVWLKQQQERLKSDRLSEVLEDLLKEVEPECIADEHAPVRSAYRYLSNHLEMLDYASALRSELPIGSGLIEGAHRHVLQKRLKLSGAWWKSDNLAAMAYLRVLRANKKWDNYWQLEKAA